jgi:hypothetical protein
MDTRISRVVSTTTTMTTTTPGITGVGVNMPQGAVAVEIRGTGTAPLWQFTPRLRKAFWFDDSAGTYTDITGPLTDRTSAQAINSFEGAASPYKDFLYFATDVPVRGYFFDVTNTNSTASIIDVLYPTAQDTWTTITPTDGTASAGATLAQDCQMAWTVPTDWVRTVQNGIGPFYWLRFGATVTLDSTVSLANVVPLGVETARIGATILATPTAMIPRYIFNADKVGGIECSGTTADTVVASWLCAELWQSTTAQ